MIRLKFVTFAALGLQLIAIGSQDVNLTRASMFLTYPLLIAVTLINWRLLGMRLILAGACLNFAVIAGNGGLMPVSTSIVAGINDREAIENLSARQAVPGSKSVVMPEDEIVLGVFADRFVVHPPVGSPKVASAGDLLIVAGLATATAQVLTRTTNSAFARNRHA